MSDPEIRINLEGESIVIDVDFLADVIESEMSERYETKVLRAVAKEILSDDWSPNGQMGFVRRGVAVLLFRNSCLDPTTSRTESVELSDNHG